MRRSRGHVISVWLSVAVAFVIGIFGPCGVAGQKSPKEIEYELKAAFIFNFMRFMEWPEGKIQANRACDQQHRPTDENGDEALPPLKVGIIGDNPFGQAWVPIAERTIRDREIIVVQVQGMDRYVKDADDEQKKKDTYYKEYADVLRRCDVVFISKSQEAYVEMLLALLAGNAVATVSDIDHFTQRGGMFGFVIEKQRVRFDIHLERAETEQITIRSQLLELARRVHQPEPSEEKQ